MSSPTSPFPPSLKVHPAAQREFKRAVAWYKKHHGTSRADTLIDSVVQGFRAILENPGRWPYHVRPVRRFVLQDFPYIIYYQQEPGVVEVVAVSHAKRNENYWMKRL